MDLGYEMRSLKKAIEEGPTKPAWGDIGNNALQFIECIEDMKAVLEKVRLLDQEHQGHIYSTSEAIDADEVLEKWFLPKDISTSNFLTTLEKAPEDIEHDIVRCQNILKYLNLDTLRLMTCLDLMSRRLIRDVKKELSKK